MYLKFLDFKDLADCYRMMRYISQSAWLTMVSEFLRLQSQSLQPGYPSSATVRNTQFSAVPPLGSSPPDQGVTPLCQLVYWATLWLSDQVQWPTGE